MSPLPARRIAFLMFALLPCLPLAAQEPLRLIATASVHDSGLLQTLLPQFEAAHKIKVQVIAANDSQALERGARGEADLLITHATSAEEQFVEAGHGLDPQDLMYNDFVLAGPKRDPLNLMEAEGILDAFDRIRQRNRLFISTGNQSGTHRKEQELWELTGQEPGFRQYRVINQDAAAALLLASQQQGYTLADRATWLRLRPQLNLDVLMEGSVSLVNIYQILLVNPQRHAGVNQQGARQLRDWLLSSAGQQHIDRFMLDGEQAFFTN